MIIEVEIKTLEVKVNGQVTGTTNIEKMHKCRDVARKFMKKDGKNTYYTLLDGKIASQHDIADGTAKRIVRYLGIKND